MEEQKAEHATRLFDYRLYEIAVTSGPEQIIGPFRKHEIEITCVVTVYGCGTQKTL